MSGGIKLQWRDRNYAEESHRIYRSDTPMSLSNMPTPIVTLTNNVTEYIDYDVIEGNTYYYRIGAVRGADEAISDELEMLAEEINYGPGPQELIAGDMTDGFFGEVSTSELFTGEELATSIGLTAGISQYSNDPWLKFSIDEKIVYIAKKPYRHTVSWDNIYQAGAVYGENSTGLFPTGTPTNQYSTLSKNGSIFKIRLLSGANSNPTLAENNSTNSNEVVFSEWNRLILPIHIDGLGNDQWASYTNEDLIVDVSGSQSWCIESSSISGNEHTRIARGGGGGVSLVRTFSSSFSNSNFVWRPVLELIP